MYCTLADLQGQVPQEVLVRLTDDEGTGAVNEARVSDAIGDAGAEIDSYCRTRYPVPFADPAPQVIRKLAVDISLYHLFSRRGFREGTEDEVIEKRYTAAVKFLQDVARGLVSIGVDTPAPKIGVDIKSNGRIFSRPKLEGM